jgi:hypothetical protein
MSGKTPKRRARTAPKAQRKVHHYRVGVSEAWAFVFDRPTRSGTSSERKLNRGAMRICPGNHVAKSRAVGSRSICRFGGIV